MNLFVTIAIVVIPATIGIWIFWSMGYRHGLDLARSVYSRRKLRFYYYDINSKRRLLRDIPLKSIRYSERKEDPDWNQSVESEYYIESIDIGAGSLCAGKEVRMPLPIMITLYAIWVDDPLYNELYREQIVEEGDGIVQVS